MTCRFNKQKTYNFFLSKFSLMKWRSTSTCLVRSCWTWLCVIWIVVLLSNYKLIGFVYLISKSFKTLLIHNNTYSLNHFLKFYFYTRSCYNFLFFTSPSNQIPFHKGQITKHRPPSCLISCPISINIAFNIWDTILRVL